MQKLKKAFFKNYVISFFLFSYCNREFQNDKENLSFKENKIFSKKIDMGKQVKNEKSKTVYTGCKTVFITGTNSGIGKACVEEFAKKGWNVAATVRRSQFLNMYSKYKNVKTYLLDVTDYEKIDKVAKQVIKDFGKVDAIINNAGFLQMGPVETTPIDQYEKIFKVNVFGLIAICKAFIPHMRERRSGTILNVASANAINGFAYFSAYSSSKMAVIGITESLHCEMEEFGVKVKTVIPGLHNSDIFAKNKVELGKEQGIEAYKPGLEQFNKIFMSLPTTSPDKAGKDIFAIVNDSSDRIKYYTGKDVKTRIWVKRLLGERAYIKLLNKVTKGEGFWAKLYAILRKGKHPARPFDIDK